MQLAKYTDAKVGPQGDIVLDNHLASAKSNFPMTKLHLRSFQELARAYCWCRLCRAYMVFWA